MDDNNNINYIQEYLKYGNIKNENSIFLEYNESSLIKELITLKIKELKKSKSQNNKMKNNKNENNGKMNNIKLKYLEDINNNKSKYNHTRNHSNNFLISNYYENIYQKNTINKKKRKISRCLNVNNLYYEEYKNSYVNIIKNKNVKDTINLTRKNNKHKSFDKNNFNSCSKLNLSFDFTNKNNNIKSLSLIVNNFPKIKKDFHNLIFSILKAEKSTSNYLYKNINNYILKINQKVNCLNELSTILKLWKNTKISYVIQKRVLDYILSKKSSNIIEIINNEIFGLKKYYEILLKYNISPYIMSFETNLFENNNFNIKELSKFKNIIEKIKKDNDIDIIWNGIKFEWILNEE